MDSFKYTGDNNLRITMNKLNYFTIVFFFYGFNLYVSNAAQIYTLKSPKGKLSYSYRMPGWKHRKNFMGFRNAFTLSTKNKKNTSSFSITSTQTKIPIDGNKLKKDLSDYKKNKLKWFKKHSVKYQSFQELKEIRTDKITIYSMGVNFATKYLGNVQERTYLVNCEDNSLFYLKSLLLEEHFSQESNIINFLKSIINCKIIE